MDEDVDILGEDDSSTDEDFEPETAKASAPGAGTSTADVSGNVLPAPC